MSDQTNHLPLYANPFEALEAETADWGDERFGAAGERYDRLRGELPPQLGAVAIIVVDETERPDVPSPLEVYGKRGINPRQFGTLLLVNYEGASPSDRVVRLTDTIERRSASTGVPTAIAMAGYDSLRQMDHIRTDAWDIAVVHALRNEIQHPVVGVSNDFDLSGASPGYLTQMTNNEFVDQPAHMWGGRYKFERPGDPDSPMNRLLDYLNIGRTLFLRFQNSAVIYGGNMALTLQTYALAGSWRHPAYTNDYGAFEDVKLLLNLWERYTNQEATKSDATAARATLFHWLKGNYTQVSPRREIFAFAHHLGDPMSMGPAFTTKLDNPVRSLTSEELGRLSDSVRAENPLYRTHLDALDSLWLGILTPQYDFAAKAILRQARINLGLPPPGFDAEDNG